MSYSYVRVGTGQSDVKLTGSTKAGAKGDYLHRLIIRSPATSLNSVILEDGSGAAITILPAGAPVGVYSFLLSMTSRNGAWQVTTDTVSSAVAVGRFS